MGDEVRARGASGRVAVDFCFQLGESGRDRFFFVDDGGDMVDCPRPEERRLLATHHFAGRRTSCSLARPALDPTARHKELPDRTMVSPLLDVGSGW
jgi:hypothetical protein